jgi:hypothetical protein
MTVLKKILVAVSVVSLGLVVSVVYLHHKSALFWLRAKAGEVDVTLAAIRAAQLSYYEENGTFIDMAAEPSTSGPDGRPGSTKRRWAPCPEEVTMSSPGHCIIGFMPEGSTYYDYAVRTNGPGNTHLAEGNVATEFFADAVGDIDHNGDLSHRGLRHAPTPEHFSLRNGTLGCEAVLDGSGKDRLFDASGPCVQGMGRTIF